MPLEKEYGRKIKSRAAHICTYCWTIIRKGEIYYFNKYFNRGKNAGEFCKLHLGCVDMYYYKCSEIARYDDHWEQWYEQISVRRCHQ